MQYILLSIAFQGKWPHTGIKLFRQKESGKKIPALITYVSGEIKDSCSCLGVVGQRLKIYGSIVRVELKTPSPVWEGVGAVR